MKMVILKEHLDGETRVALSPEVAKKFIELGFNISLEKGAGILASFSDEMYKNVGVKIITDTPSALRQASIVLKVRRPDLSEIKNIANGTVLIANLGVLTDQKDVASMAKAGITSFAMELMPRITRAQSMDILSSQSNLAGYKAVLDAAAEIGRAFPMMMTAAGTVAPAKVFVMGVGVAGLQAIATAKRMGAVVTATDVRPATREQVESLGGKFLEIDPEMEKNAQTEGGYAKEMPKEYFEIQKKVVAEHIKSQDVVITTALIPGRPAPVLIPKELVTTMRNGAVIVDLAVEAGGNCEISKLGEIFTTANGVKIVGHSNMPGRVAEDASSLFSRNLYNFISPHVDKDKKELKIEWEDEIITGTLITKDGEIVNDQVKNLIGVPKKRKKVLNKKMEKS